MSASLWRHVGGVRALMPAVLAAGLLGAGLGGADHVSRAEKAVAARLSWCGVDERAGAVERTRWVRQDRTATGISDVVTVPTTAGSGGAGGLTVIATPAAGGGWRVVAADAATARTLGSCLDSAAAARGSAAGAPWRRPARTITVRSRWSYR